MSARTKLTLGAAVGLLAGLVWLWGQVAALITARRWLDVRTDELLLTLIKLPFLAGDPRRAWPPHTWGDLPGPLGMYACALLVFGNVALLVLLGLRAAGRRLLGRRPWRTPQSALTTPAAEAGGGWAGWWELRHLLCWRPPEGRVLLGRVLTGRAGWLLGRVLTGRAVHLAGRLGPWAADRLRVWVEACHSLLVFGPPGSFKTTALIIPAILGWTGPVIATSVKADIIHATRAAREALGQVIILDPLGSSGLGTHRWSPLGACKTFAGAQQTAAALAATEHLEHASAEHRFWVELAEGLLAPLLYAAASTHRAMVDVVGWVQHHPHEQDQHCRLASCPVQEITAILTRLGDELALRAWRSTLGRADGDLRLLDSIYATAEKLLKVYGDARVAAFTAGNDVDWIAVLAGCNTVYLYAPPDEQDRLRPIFEVILSDALRVAQQQATATRGGMLKLRLLLALDEAGNVAALADLPRWATIARGLGIQLLTVWHDFSQLTGRYGTRAATVLNAHRAKVFLSGLADLDTLDVASRLIGEHAVTEHAETHVTSGDRSRSQHRTYRPLLPPDALRRLRPGDGVVVYGHLRPFRIRLCPWFAEPHQRRPGRPRTDQGRPVEPADSPEPVAVADTVDAGGEPVVPLAAAAPVGAASQRIPAQLSAEQWQAWRRSLQQGGGVEDGR